jgi:hypothetical protein
MPREKTNEKEGERERKREKKQQKGKTLVFILKLRKKTFFSLLKKGTSPPKSSLSLCCLGFFLNRSLDKKGKKTAPLSLPLSKPPAARARGSSAAAEGPAP